MIKYYFAILNLLVFFSARGQRQFDSLQVERILLTFSNHAAPSLSDTNIIRAIEAVDRKYRIIADTLYSFKSRKHTIFQTIPIESNDSVFIDPLSLADKIQTMNIVFDNKQLNIKVDSVAKSLAKSERVKFYSYLANHFDSFSKNKKKLSAQPVRIRYIKFPDNEIVQVGIDIYGNHFLWTIARNQNWDVIKVDNLWIY